MITFWKNYQWQWTNLYNSPFGKHYEKIVMEQIDSASKNNNTVIDIGEGMGRFFHPIASRGLDVTLLDIDPIKIKKIKNKYQNIKVINADNMSFKTTSLYYFVICIGLIQYLDSFDKFIKNILKLFPVSKIQQMPFEH